MEGESDLKKQRVLTKLETAWADLYVFKNNLFIDWMRDATEEEKQWAKRVFGCHTKPSWEWEMQSADCVVLVNGIGSVYLTLARDQSPLYQAVDPFPLLTYPWERDNCIRALDTGALGIIYSVLHSPEDMLHFMRVNKRFRKAALNYLGYDTLIKRLMERGKVLEWPMFKTVAVKSYQRFFAMCFLSCKDDDMFSDCMFKDMHAGNWDLILYVRNLIEPLKGGGVLKDELIWMNGKDTPGIVYKTYGNKERLYYAERQLILVGDAFYFPHARSSMPIAELKQRACEAAFPRHFFVATAPCGGGGDKDKN